MRVVFLQDVVRVARAGEVKEVADGYARNYLIPQGLAALATQEELKRIERIKKAAEERRLKELQDIEALARELDSTTITVRAKASPTGRFYGAITSTQIAQELAKLTARELDRKLVELEEPIHEPGSYTATLHLHPEVKASITVVAEGEG